MAELVAIGVNQRKMMMKVYITKYALTKGIIVRDDAELCRDVSDKMISVPGQFTSYFHKPDWHETRETALTQCERMRAAKIKSVEKQLARLRELYFS